MELYPLLSQRRKQKFEWEIKLIIKTTSVLYIEARKIDKTEKNDPFLT